MELYEHSLEQILFLLKTSYILELCYEIRKSLVTLHLLFYLFIIVAQGSAVVFVKLRAANTHLKGCLYCCYAENRQLSINQQAANRRALP